MADFHEIEDGIFIGNIKSVIGDYSTKESDVLDILNIKVVISALSEEEYDDNMVGKEDFPDIEWHRLVISDDDNEKISPHFSSVYNLVKLSRLENKNIFIHCLGGLSRSPTLVIAYLMIEHRWSFEEAHNFVKIKRPYIYINNGFINQLKELEYKIKKADKLLTK